MRRCRFRNMRRVFNCATTCAIVLAIALLSGCTLFSPVENTIRVAVIDKLPLNLPQQKTRPATLLVLPPNTNPVYDTIRIAYRTKPHQVDYFAKQEWGATPAQMLLPLLSRTLENTQAFEAVVTPPYFGPYRYAIRTEITELTQDFTSNPAALSLALRVQLIDGRSNKILLSKAITQHEPILHKGPYAGVVATNDATAQALQTIASFVIEYAQ